jgi:hypothetical protein
MTPKSNPRLPKVAKCPVKGDRVMHPGYMKATGIVCRANKTRAYVEWTGFPPDVPLDGWLPHGEIRRIPQTRQRGKGKKPSEN